MSKEIDVQSKNYKLAEKISLRIQKKLRTVTFSNTQEAIALINKEDCSQEVKDLAIQSYEERAFDVEYYGL